MLCKHNWNSTPREIILIVTPDLSMDFKCRTASYKYYWKIYSLSLSHYSKWHGYMLTTASKFSVVISIEFLWYYFVIYVLTTIIWHIYKLKFQIFDFLNCMGEINLLEMQQQTKNLWINRCKTIYKVVIFVQF